MDISALKELAAKVEAGEWDHSPNGVARQVFPYKSASIDDLGLTAVAAFNGSLDAAKALHDAVLPGFRWEGGSGGLFDVWDDPAEPHKGRCDIPARAWLLAILRALIAENSQ